MLNCALARNRSLVAALSLLLLMLWAGESSAVTIDWAIVGHAGNAASTSGHGAVGNSYAISKFEVTNGHYAEFLNAVAATDTNDLYNTSMAFGVGGISRSGGPGTFAYSAQTGREDLPVNFVSFYDALRFSNWLHNGQPLGFQDNTTTEDGAYTITAAGIAANSITRNVGATTFLPTLSEWFKAAFYDGSSATYFAFAGGSDTQPTCASPTATANSSNCNMALGDFAPVGSYTGSPSPNGTFDQGGNIREWTEGIGVLGHRVVGGGGFESNPADIGVDGLFQLLPDVETFDQGFRIAAIVPEPGTGLLFAAGVLLAVRGSRRRSRS